MNTLHIKRVYEAAAASDGYRVLVDRLWPRGVAKAAANIDLWLKDIAPSAELREWFAHDPAKFAEFRKRYHAELAHNEAVAELQRLMRQHRALTLLFGAKDTAHNNAVVLQEFLGSRQSTPAL